MILYLQVSPIHENINYVLVGANNKFVPDSPLPNRFYQGFHSSSPVSPPHIPPLLLPATTRPHALEQNHLDFLLTYQGSLVIKNALAFFQRALRECFRLWDLRITCAYNYIPKEDIFELTGMTLHGLWESVPRGSRIASVPHPMEDAVWKGDLAIADRLYSQLEPAFVLKMNEIWWTTPNHTYANNKLHKRQMVDHGYLSCEYWKKAVEMAQPFMADDGEFNLMKILEEEGFVSGTFKGDELKKMLERRTGRVVYLLFIKMRGKTYPGEFGLLHNLEHKFISHPAGDEDLPSFVLEKPKPN